MLDPLCSPHSSHVGTTYLVIAKLYVQLLGPALLVGVFQPNISHQCWVNCPLLVYHLTLCSIKLVLTMLDLSTSSMGTCVNPPLLKHMSVFLCHCQLRLSVSDLTTEAFIATLRRFVSRRGKPLVIWSDHGSNFIGAAKELKDLFEFLNQKCSRQIVSQFCSNQNIQWDFIPKRAPHFGGLWEAAVKNFKTHLKRVTTNVKLTYEELSTILTQIEACLNSRPLTRMYCDDDGVEALTPGHFLIGRPIEALPDVSDTDQPLTLLKHWHLCQTILNHFWKRWSGGYISSLQRYAKWNKSTRNIKIGDVVIIREDGLLPTKWAIARVVDVHPGQDNVVRVVTIRTSTGTYKRPVTKVAVLIPIEQHM